MLKSTRLMAVLALGLFVSVNAQDRVQAKKAPAKDDAARSTSTVVMPSLGVAAPTSQEWKTVDTMSNGYGPAISNLDPIQYDPWSNTATLVRRGTAATGGSGTIWYNYSTNAGSTWARVAAFNSDQTSKVGRYPSGAISNPTKSSDIANTMAVASWPQLNPSAFGFLGYGADQPVGGAATVSFLDQGGSYSSQVPIHAIEGSPWVIWSSDNSVDAGIKIFRTQDFSTIDTLTPAALNSAAFADGGNVTVGYASLNGVIWIGLLGTMPDAAGTTHIAGGWYPGYSKSTDNGATWSTIKLADFRSATGVSNNDVLWDYIKGDAYVAYVGDIAVDKNGKVHFLLAVTDTTVDRTQGKNSIIELVEGESNWSGSVVATNLSDSSFTNFDGMGLGQMGPGTHLATNKTHDVMVASWVSGTTAVDTLNDIWMSSKRLTGNWGTPVNLTATPADNENGSHMASMIKMETDNTFSAFVGYWYPLGYHGSQPDPTLAAAFYVAKVAGTLPTDVNDPSEVKNFELSQNYPNPFNPSTSISFKLAERSNVTLKVFDVLGREVATLVNETKEAGSHNVSFDASKLSSGLYVYTLKAGNMTATKKMMLMK